MICFLIISCRYSYPLLNGNIPGVRRLPLSPIKPGTAGSSSDVFRKPNILVGSKSARGAPKRRASASLLDNKSPDYDIYDPMNSAAETFSAGCFHFQRNRILRRIRKPEEGPDAFAVLPDEMVRGRVELPRLRVNQLSITFLLNHCSINHLLHVALL